MSEENQTFQSRFFFFFFLRNVQIPIQTELYLHKPGSTALDQAQHYVGILIIDF